MTFSPRTIAVEDRGRSMRSWITRARTVRVPTSKALELHVAELQQLFDPLDPRPCRERPLDPRAHDFIVERGRELPNGAPLGLLVHLDGRAGLSDEQAVLRDAVHGHFQNCADASWGRLRELFRVGRISLLIGLAFLAIAVAAGQLLERDRYDAHFLVVLRDTVVIGGWVAMWRPLQIFLYDWWPIRAEARLFERLAAMSVHLRRQPSKDPSIAARWRSCEVHASGSM